MYNNMFHMKSKEALLELSADVLGRVLDIPFHRDPDEEEEQRIYLARK